MINTLKYGTLPVARADKFLNNECIDTIETCDGKFYEVRKTLNGVLVAFENID